jgi:hypothetical protein
MLTRGLLNESIGVRDFFSGCSYLGAIERSPIAALVSETDQKTLTGMSNGHANSPPFKSRGAHRRDRGRSRVVEHRPFQVREISPRE